MSDTGGWRARIEAFVENDKKKIGGMTFDAFGRLGLAELRQAVTLDGSIADRTPTPYGMYGTLTPGEVSAARQSEEGVHGPSDAGDERIHDPLETVRRTAAASSEKKREDGKGAE